MALSSMVTSSEIDLTWNFTSNDTRVTVIPTTITTDDSIGIIYTTVIQFDYLMEGNYTCTATVDRNSANSTVNLVGKHTVTHIAVQYTHVSKQTSRKLFLILRTYLLKLHFKTGLLS